MQIVMEKDKEYMREAIKLSIEHMQNGDGGPFGCIITDKQGKIIARGWNQVLVSKDPTAHAEVMAIREACRYLGAYQLEGCTVYTTCEPCPMCLGAIYWARPEKVFYANTSKDAAEAGFDDSFIYRELNMPLDNREIPLIKMDNAEAIVAFRLWEEKPDREPY